MEQFTTQEFAEHVSGTLVGVSDLKIVGVAEIQEARPDQVTFIGRKRFVALWADSHASSAVINSDFEAESGPGRALIQVPSADLAMAQILELFQEEPPDAPLGVHASAIVDDSATIGVNVSIGPGCYLGPNVTVGDETVLYSNVTLMDHAAIGKRCVLWPGTVVRERCSLGADCILHLNVSVGADGFGYRPAPDTPGMVKIPQIGNVVIGNKVEIGANTCIDRGKFGSTRIGDGTKIDNLVQIAHNCCIGRSCVIAGSTGISGSVTIGNFVVMGGGVGIADHLTIGDKARIAIRSLVIDDVAPGETVSGSPANAHKQTLRQCALIRKLPKLLKQLPNRPRPRP